MKGKAVKLVWFYCTLILSGCMGTSCDENLDTCNGYGGFAGTWSEDDQLLATVSKDFGKTLADSDNRAFLYTIAPDGSQLTFHGEVGRNDQVAYLNRTNAYAILAGESGSYSLYTAYFKYVDLTTNEVTTLKDMRGLDCRTYRIIPSFDGNLFAVLEAMRFSELEAIREAEAAAQQTNRLKSLDRGVVTKASATTKAATPSPRGASTTPISSYFYSLWSNTVCGQMALRVTLQDARTSQPLVVADSFNANFQLVKDYEGPVYTETAPVFWTETGFVIADFNYTVEDYTHIDLSGNLSSYTPAEMDCMRLKTTSSTISNSGETATVYAFYQSETASVETETYDGDIPLCSQ